MKDNAHADSRVLSLFHLIIIITVILILMSVFLRKAEDVQIAAENVSVKQNSQIFRERLMILQNQWIAAKKPQIYERDGFRFKMTTRGWPQMHSETDCVALAEMLLSTHFNYKNYSTKFDRGRCLYSTKHFEFSYNYQLESIELLEKK